MCSLLLMSIFQSAFALKYPRDPYPPMSTPVKPFNVPANSPAASQLSKSKILSPTVHILLKSYNAFLYADVLLEIDATEAKTVQSC